MAFGDFVLPNIASRATLTASITLPSVWTGKNYIGVEPTKTDEINNGVAKRCERSRGVILPELQTVYTASPRSLLIVRVVGQTLT